jgi:hypothetical protein
MVQGYSHITPKAGMAMKKASDDDSPLWQGAGKSFWTRPISGRRRRRLTILFLDGGSPFRVFLMK